MVLSVYPPQDYRFLLLTTQRIPQSKILVTLGPSSIFREKSCECSQDFRFVYFLLKKSKKIVSWASLLFFKQQISVITTKKNASSYKTYHFFPLQNKTITPRTVKLCNIMIYQFVSVYRTRKGLKYDPSGNHTTCREEIENRTRSPIMHLLNFFFFFSPNFCENQFDKWAELDVGCH